MTKCLFFDIDSTLVSRNKGTIPSAVEALHRTREKGNIVFIATGRQLASLQHADAYERDGIVFCNGAGIWMNGRILETSPIPAEAVENVIREADRKEGMYSLQSAYRTFKNERELERMKCSLPDDPRFETFEEMLNAFGAGSLSEYKGEDILKIDIGFRNSEIMEDFRRALDPRVHLILQAGANASLGKRSGEITRADADKSTGVQKVMNMLGIQREDTFAFGDSGNDIGMLELCGTGVAVGNASAEAKAHADFIAKEIENNGIADAMSVLGLL